jgi:hypothetical protein
MPDALLKQAEIGDLDTPRIVFPRLDTKRILLREQDLMNCIESALLVRAVCHTSRRRSENMGPAGQVNVTHGDITRVLCSHDA